MSILTFQLKVLLAIFVLLSLVGCGNYGYKVASGKVIFSFWDGSKEVKRTLPDADAKSFKILLQNHFGTDNRTVYRREKPISGANAKTFRLINRWHAVDKHHGYHDGQLIPNSIAASFESLSSTFSKDGEDVYIATSAIDACHSPSYQLLTNFWAKDKECAYAGFNRIEGASIETFEGLNRFYAKDKNRV
ncbi:MAG: DKNYY domain-containing protein [Granulosicoccus sp.]